MYTSEIFAFASLLGASFFFIPFSRSFYVLLSTLPCLSPRPPLSPLLLVRFTSLVNIIRDASGERLNTFFFNLGFALGRMDATPSFSIYATEISSVMLEGTSRFLENVRYVCPFLHEMEFVACLLDSSKCLPTDCTV